MRAAQCLVSLGLIGLGYTTFFVTRSLLAQGAPEAAAHAVKAPAAAPTFHAGPVPAQPGAVDASGDITAARDLRWSKVDAGAGQVVITAHARVLDRRPNMKYLWWLTIWEQDDPTRILVDRPDTARLLAVPQGQKVEFPFADTVPLPPGKYAAQIQIFEVPPEAQLDRFPEIGYAAKWQSVRATHKFTVTP